MIPATFQEKVTPILHKRFQSLKRNYQNSFCESRVTTYQSQTKTVQIIFFKKTYKPISVMNTATEPSIKYYQATL